MSEPEIIGVVDATKTYTQKSLAETLGRKEKWVFTNVIHEGCPYWKIGRIYFISGKSFQLFIEDSSVKWEPIKRGKVL